MTPSTVVNLHDIDLKGCTTIAQVEERVRAWLDVKVMEWSDTLPTEEMREDAYHRNWEIVEARLPDILRYLLATRCGPHHMTSTTVH